MTFLQHTEMTEPADVTGGVPVQWLCSRSYTNQPVEGIIPKGQKPLISSLTSLGWDDVG